MTAERIAAALHVAADRVWPETGTPFMDALAEAGAIFIHESDLTNEEQWQARKAEYDDA
jgi:hypothetical protein